MPELPEVETTVRVLRPYIVGETIIDVWNDYPPTVRLDIDELRYRTHQQSITAVHRRAKYLIFDLSNGEHLIVHLRMSGHLSVLDGDEPRHKHVHTAFLLASGKELRFRDMRKFGTVDIVQELEPFFVKIGPEPLSSNFTPEVLKDSLKGTARIIKTALLDQTKVAGIGNIYADEALFYAKISPEKPANQLSKEELILLHEAIQKVLILGIAREGASLDIYAKPDGTRGEMQNEVAVFRRTGQPCRSCGSTIERKRLHGRSTHFCPTCQRS